MDESKLMFKDKPLHDWSSHGADAFRYLALSFDQFRQHTQLAPTDVKRSGAGLNTTKRFKSNKKRVLKSLR